MKNFTYFAPTKVLFGRGVEADIGTELKALGASRVLVHFGGLGGNLFDGEILQHTQDVEFLFVKMEIHNLLPFKE